MFDVKYALIVLISSSKLMLVGPALKAVSDQYNTLIEKVEQLKEALAELEVPKQYRILTYDYFKALCKQNSKILAHSLLPQRRAFVDTS